MRIKTIAMKIMMTIKMRIVNREIDDYNGDSNVMWMMMMVTIRMAAAIRRQLVSMITKERYS